ncbi:MAG TPA: oxygenase MpaB family protein [Methylomirabilota bacterium]|nr:oxygenase MpaB family protein [Methylomirabilota bacterium]
MSTASSVLDVPEVSWKIHGEVVLLLGWGSAILLQFAHPLVARGVADHSGFRRGWLAPWRRLHRTLHAMVTLTFGGEEAARRIAGAINAVHDRVHGALTDAEGPFPRGTRYTAHDPALLAWVHATCLHAFMSAYELYVGPLTGDDKDRYCAESAAAAPLLGLSPSSLPRSQAELDAYMARMLASGDIVVTATARRLARELLTPPVLRHCWPVRWLLQLTAVGLLPDAIREAYGIRWTARHRRALVALAWLVRHARPLVPPPLRQWPMARSARRARARTHPVL